MSDLVHQLVTTQAAARPGHAALTYKGERRTYAELADLVADLARALAGLGLGHGERLAVYLEKRIETVAALFGATMAGGVFVPVNPLLRPRQLGYILRDCAVRVLVTSPERAPDLAEELAACPELLTLVLTGPVPALAVSGSIPSL